MLARVMLHDVHIAAGIVKKNEDEGVPFLPHLRKLFRIIKVSIHDRRNHPNGIIGLYPLLRVHWEVLVLMIRSGRWRG